MILSVGEILIDVIEGVSKVGGAPFNVAVNASRLGGDVSFVGSIGKDEEGEFLKNFASSFGFNTLLLKEDMNRKTTKAIVELKDGERSFRFERDNTADAYLPDIDDSLLSRSNIIHIGSLPLSIKEGKEHILSLIDKAHKMNKKISFDVNFRSDVYSSVEEAIEISKRICLLSDIVKLSEDEISLLGEGFIKEELKDKMVFITLGKKGSMCSYKGKDTFAKSEPIKPIDTTGAGDAFMGAVLYMLDKDQEPNMEEVLSFANKVARECCLHLGAI